ncbi:hypothetical protein MMC07_002130 [Pseudocyphellaria aurata]|nr:hypothetical protein [Pseudocyphellaria aurata]
MRKEVPETTPISLINVSFVTLPTAQHPTALLRRPAESSQTLPELRTLLTTISNLIAHHTSTASSYEFAPEPLLLALGVHQPLNPCLELSTEEWEDFCRESGGWEWIDGEVGDEMGRGKERNEFGGLARLLEALEANDWSNGEPNNDDLDSDSDLDSILDTIENPETGSGTTQSHDPDLQIGLLEGHQTSKAERDGQEEGEEEEGEADSQVQELEAMMLKMQAVRESSRDIPEADRRKFAARAVRGVLRGVSDL